MILLLFDAFWHGFHWFSHGFHLGSDAARSLFDTFGFKTDFWVKSASEQQPKPLNAFRSMTKKDPKRHLFRLFSISLELPRSVLHTRGRGLGSLATGSPICAWKSSLRTGRIATSDLRQGRAARESILDPDTTSILLYLVHIHYIQYLHIIYAYRHLYLYIYRSFVALMLLFFEEIGLVIIPSLCCTKDV